MTNDILRIRSNQHRQPGYRQQWEMVQTLDETGAYFNTRLDASPYETDEYRNMFFSIFKEANMEYMSRTRRKRLIKRRLLTAALAAASLLALYMFVR